MLSQFGELRSIIVAEIGLPVWDTYPANFNRFRVLASLMHRRRSTKVNQILPDVWPFPELVHCIQIFGGSCPLTEFYHVQNSLCVQVLSSPIRATLLHAAHGTRIVGVCQTGVQHAAPSVLNRALEISPHSSNVLLMFTKFLLHIDIFRSKKLLLKQSNNRRCNKR